MAKVRPFLKYEISASFNDVLSLYRDANNRGRNVIATLHDPSNLFRQYKYIYRVYPSGFFVKYQIISGFLSFENLINYCNDNFCTIIEIVKRDSSSSAMYAAIVRVYPHSNMPTEKLSDI